MKGVIQEEMAVDIEAQAKKQHEGAAIFKKSNLPVTLKFTNVQYKVKQKETAQSCSCNMKIIISNSSDEEKVILKGITGLVLPGEMLAMLGPSGSGKTTLLSALGGRLRSGHLYGDITFNDKPFSNPMRRNTGFVTQDDVLYPHLTVTETLVFTALLRLPNTMTKQQKIQHAEAVIHQLDLIKCKDSIIGDQFKRGVSGGERKRVSIGQEMLINPSLLFLDEPTSGLDSTTAQRIVRNLSDLAKGGRTVVMTIHQPSSRLFYMFDKVLLLSDGNSLYFGAGSRAMDYFASVGYSPSLAMNPADFLLDLANGVPPNDDDSISSHDPVMVKQALVSAYKSNIAPTLMSDFKEVTGQQHHNGPNDKEFPGWSTTWWQQFTVLLRRGVKERKHESFSHFQIGQVLVVAFIAGLLWWQTKAANIQERTGLLFCSTVFWGFFPLFEAIFTFPQERKMLEKERSAGTYRLSSYFMSRMVSDLPMELVLPTIFVTITYWMAGLQPSAGNFFHTLFVLLFSVLVSQGLGLAIGALVMDQKSATTLGSVIMLTSVLAGGYYVQHVPPFIGWIKYISLSQYTYKLLLGSQFKQGDTYPCNAAGGVCLVDDFPGIKKVGLDGQLIDAVALGLMLVFYRVIAYLALMRIGVMKKCDLSFFGFCFEKLG